ncbi:MAG TPA: ABC transporter ATP-binding protein [Spirochaetales bacterium]|nr:ABC transporter ATP-binding protein [Spirochaetales bacterium]
MSIHVNVSGLVKQYPVKAGLFSRTQDRIHAVNGVSFQIPKGQTLGLVGESGCGKTTTARLLLRVIEPDGGYFQFEDVEDVFKLEPEELRRVRSRMQYVFQDPYSSLNPKMLIRDIVTEPIRYQKGTTRRDLEQKAGELLEHVGLSADAARKYPHEFSGGQRQRISIARALSSNPSFIICDEPVSSLDVSIQSQILNLLIDLQNEMGITYLFIAHNLSVVFYMSDTVAVMYTGKIVEKADSRELFENPLHPYTRLLLKAMTPEGRNDPILKNDTGEVPSLIQYPEGCTFFPRCPLRQDQCLAAFPPLKEEETRHFVACYRIRPANRRIESPVAD